MFRPLHHALLIASVSTAACIGNIGGDNAPPDDLTSTSAFTCDPSNVAPRPPLRRLSKRQYANTLRDLVSAIVPDHAPEVMSILDPLVEALPGDLPSGPDDRFGTFTRLDQTVHQEHVDVAYGIVSALGRELTTVERIGSAVGSCAADADASNDAACLDDFIRRIGERALRAPVSDEDVVFYRAVAGDTPYEPADYADVVGLLLMSPRFNYFVELGVDQALTAYELASRLSYHFWETMPDEQLLEAARSGALATDAGFTVQLERLFADPRTEETLRFFFREWLNRPDVEELDSRVGTPVFDAFTAGFVPGPDLRERMFDEVSDAALYAINAGESFDVFFTNRRSFAKTDDLAALYGVPVWDGATTPPEMPDPERAGLLTRAAMLANASADTRPIMKGVFIRKALLCDTIPPPPPNAAATKPELSETLGIRETVEELTEQPGSACAGCHAIHINPLGFTTENFDALGRLRTEEPLYDQATGEIVGTRPIDTTSVAQVVAGDMRPTADARELAAQVLESEKVQACMARHYVRFTFGRTEDSEGDGCMLTALHARMLSGAPLSEVLRDIAYDPSFRSRLPNPGGDP
jgi:hypothetical protein